MGMSPFELAIPFLFMEQSFIGKGMTKTQSVFLSLDIRSIHFGVHVGRSNAICVKFNPAILVLSWPSKQSPGWLLCSCTNNSFDGQARGLGQTTGQELPVSGRKWDLNPISFMIAALVQSVCM